MSNAALCATRMHPEPKQRAQSPLLVTVVSERIKNRHYSLQSKIPRSLRQGIFKYICENEENVFGGRLPEEQPGLMISKIE